jgi:hypothetical protein
MTQQHPITPPPELIQRWSEQFEAGRSLYAMFEDIYRAGADAELEACCKWLPKLPPWSGEDLRRHCRPKPPSLKEQALKRLTEAERTLIVDPDGIIRRALEQLDD